MNDIVLFSLPGNEKLTEQLAVKMKTKIGKAMVRKFPDGEWYIRILSGVKNKNVVLVCTLHEPNDKLLPLYFLSQTSKMLGAKNVYLVVPYLAYMRQDKMFNPGEGITSTYFANLISKFADGIITIDPHLHRIKSLSNIYHIPNTVIHAASEISKWIKEHIKNPVLIGPDSESKQWVSEVAKNIEAPFIVLNKTRLSDTNVKISVLEMEHYKSATPVLVDDIISTGHTMIETINQLKNMGIESPVCIGIHAVFAGNAYQKLLDCGVNKIVTCNTIPHPSNEIDLSDILSEKIRVLVYRLE